MFEILNIYLRCLLDIFFIYGIYLCGIYSVYRHFGYEIYLHMHENYVFKHLKRAGGCCILNSEKVGENS